MHSRLQGERVLRKSSSGYVQCAERCFSFQTNCLPSDGQVVVTLKLLLKIVLRFFYGHLLLEKIHYLSWSWRESIIGTVKKEKYLRENWMKTGFQETVGIEIGKCNRENNG